PKHYLAAGVAQQARRQSAIGGGREEWAKNDGRRVSIPAGKWPSGYRARRPRHDCSDRAVAKRVAGDGAGERATERASERAKGWTSERTSDRASGWTSERANAGRPDCCDQTTARWAAER